MTPGAKQTLQRAAAVAKRSVTYFMLESALASAAATLADRQSFQLDPEQWEAFVAALDAPSMCHGVRWIWQVGRWPPQAVLASTGCRV
jgi:uncharacterized protein (DUF1778 family)